MEDTMSLDPWYVDLEDNNPRHLAEEGEGWEAHVYGPGEEEDGEVDESAWLSAEAVAELERAWSAASASLDLDALPF
jgi:hypothetical protein